MPAKYFLFDKKSKALTLLAESKPFLEGYTFSNMKEISYKARDGLKIPAYLTLPITKTNTKPPLIVYPHGGPYARDYWRFENYVQFFANRGYAVLQPQFRGSRGFGTEHEEAGYKQWGLAMQDDITDGVHHLIEQGLVDKERICILGGSYGGYASAMGLIKTPDLYKCGVTH